MSFESKSFNCPSRAGAPRAHLNASPHFFILLALVLLLPMPATADMWGGIFGDEAANRLHELRAAAEQGSAHSQFLLGTIYDTGKGVPQDYAEAVRWYRMAAERGHDKAQNNLGVLFEDGHGVMRDYREALGWYRKAAEQGLSYAQFNLAEMYLHGRGVEVSLDQARSWYRKAASQGYVKAITALENDRLRENAGQPRFWSDPHTEPPAEPPLQTCVKQVQKELPHASFDAYGENGTVHMFGTPESFFKFQKCMSMAGHPLKDK